MTTSAGPGGPLTGIGGAGPNAAAAAARARFGPSPFDDPSFEIPAFSPSVSGDSPFDDRAFLAPGPGLPAPLAPGPGTPPLGKPTLDEPALGGRPGLGGPGLGGPARGATPPGGVADAGRPAAPAGNGGSRGSGRHGAARGSSGGNSPLGGGADADDSGLARAGDAPVPPMRTLGSAHRLNAVRGPQPSGHPPWEPAEKPASELPWMDAPGSGQSRMVPPRRVFSVGSEGTPAGPAGGLGGTAGGLGGTAGGLGGSGRGPGGLGTGGTGAGQVPAGPTSAGEVPAGPTREEGTGTGRPTARPADPGPSMTAAGLVRRRPKSQSPFLDLDGPPAGLAGPPADGSSDDAADPRPMYSWNPSDPTEAFPAVPPPGDSRPG
ncbi:MAG TPA: hypothetical protein VIE45_11675 [Streptosporangiaceae bacterium]